MSSRWQREGAARGVDYDVRWASLEAAGLDPHGEAAFVAAYRPARVLDAGCGTGRVAIELARRDIGVVGVDLDEAMLASARHKAPELEWRLGDLVGLDLVDESGDRRTFDVIVAAGNVMIFLEPGTEAGVLERSAMHLGEGGRLVAGFGTERLALDRYDELCASVGLVLDERYATWDRAPHDGTGYAVSVHRVA